MGLGLRNWNHTLSLSDPAVHVLSIEQEHGLVPVPPSGYAKKPVTYVSYREAVQYCKHVGKRLPEAWEYQYFATVRIPKQQ